MSGFVNKTIGQIIEETADLYPENAALICPQFGVRQNYREFYRHCRNIAKGLIALGIQRGDKVSVWTTNIPEWVYLQFSLGMVGGVLVTVNTNYQSHELAYILKQSDSTTLFPHGILPGYQLLQYRPHRHSRIGCFCTGPACFR